MLRYFFNIFFFGNVILSIYKIYKAEINNGLPETSFILFTKFCTKANKIPLKKKRKEKKEKGKKSKKKKKTV
jgi:hypothetical protein